MTLPLLQLSLSPFTGTLLHSLTPHPDLPSSQLMARVAESAALSAESDRLREALAEGQRALAEAEAAKTLLEGKVEELSSRVVSMTPLIANARLDGQVWGDAGM